MAQNSASLFLFACLMFLSCSQGQEAAEDVLFAEQDLPSAKVNCPEGANSYGSHCYYFVEDRLNWGEADLFCQNINSGHLVSLLSQTESNFVASLIKESVTTTSNVWTGLYDPKNNRRWHWSSGSPFLFKSWATGAPNTSNRGFCVSLTSNTAYKRWKDDNCDSQFSFVCKFKP